ncbi:hypothetical protein HYR99_13645 [Candidatus Poribacteria bacterium]|nr:hypothetical protein [Candidatus Poribacteria bacterium]
MPHPVAACVAVAGIAVGVLFEPVPDEPAINVIVYLAAEWLNDARVELEQLAFQRFIKIVKRIDSVDFPGLALIV